MKQVHGHTVTRATRETAGHRPEADIAICDDPTLGLAVQAADCVPLLVADRRKGVVAAAHAGWRGLAQGVPQMTVQALVAEFRSSPADLVVAIGPSVGACCYEVGADVRREFETHSEGRSGHTRWFHDGPRVIPGNPSMPDLRTTRREGHAFFDGWAAAEDQLRASGVPAASIFMAELCTASHANWFWSYRREGSQAKRLVGAIRAAASGTRPSAA
jgi:YfiH family protein